MRASVAVVVLAGALAGCGGHSVHPFRIGVLSDCYGPFSGTNAVVMAAATLPLVERGARPAASAVDVAGRRVVLDYGCVAGTEDVLPEARRLVEEDGARAIVGPLDPQQGMVLETYARRRPETVFLVQPSDSPELTLHGVPPNVFRFAPDSTQEVAGLGTYAYQHLGWRTAVTVGDDAPYGWSRVAAFVAEFCALGGHIAHRDWLPPGSDTAPSGAGAALADGAFLATVLSPPGPFLEKLSAAEPEVGAHLVAGDAVARDPTLRRLGRGVVVAGVLPAAPSAAMDAYARAFAQAFPALPRAVALLPLVIGYRDGVEAVLEALAQDGSLRAELASLTLDSPLGKLRLDRNHQAIVPVYLSRIGARPSLVETITGVTESFGGVFSGAEPPAGRTQPPCVRRTPAPWSH